MSLPPVVNLIEVLSTLISPEDYVCGMLENMYDYKTEYSNVTRAYRHHRVFGITGYRDHPH
jgi:hypothetical protein